MSRLTDRAFEIMRAEIRRCVTVAGTPGQSLETIALNRLERLRTRNGPPATLTELRDTVHDLFPQFSEKVLKKAAKANRPPGMGHHLLWVGAGIVSLAGFLWVVNLPFPPIRRPIADKAPLLLLPSFFSMDSNYRQAMAKVEQADQLINNATAAADFELGAIKAQEAQKHLDALPVWFLGYYPQAYCHWFTCTWRFTLDEFEAARKTIGRMEAQIFQEKNALVALSEAEQALNAAKQQYQEAGTAAERQTATMAWQAAIDQLGLIPSQTLAGETAQKKVNSSQRDFREMGGIATGNQESNNLIEAAKEFAMSAAVASQNPPHTTEQWEKVIELWQTAIQRLNQVRVDNPGYLDAQTKLAQYQSNLATTEIRRKAEYDSVKSFQQAKSLLANLQTYLSGSSPNQNYGLGQLQTIINELEKVQPGTTVYAEAQTWLVSAKNKQQQWQSQTPAPTSP